MRNIPFATKAFAVLMLLTLKLSAQNSVSAYSELLSGNAYDYNYDRGGNLIMYTYRGYVAFCGGGIFYEQGHKEETSEVGTFDSDYSITGTWKVQIVNGAPILILVNSKDNSTTRYPLSFSNGSLYVNNGPVELYKVICQ